MHLKCTTHVTQPFEITITSQTRCLMATYKDSEAYEVCRPFSPHTITTGQNYTEYHNSCSIIMELR